MTTGRINQIATVRDRARPILAERALNDPESLEFKRALAKATKGFGSHSAVNSDRFRNTELDAPIIEQCSPSARTRPHSRSSSRGGSLAHPLGRRIGRGSRTVTLRRTQSPHKRTPVAAVGGAASRIASHDARSRSSGRHSIVEGNSPPGWRANRAFQSLSTSTVRIAYQRNSSFPSDSLALG